MKVWQAVAILIAVWAAFYLPWLGTNELRGEEARRTLPARTMLETGDWIVPRIGGEVYNRKPPLINWVMAASFKVTGVQNDWTSRLPSVLFTLSFSLVALCALRRRFGVNGALLAGVIFLTTTGMLDKGRMAEIEALYVALFGIAWVLWAVWWSEGRSRWLSYTVPWLLLGVAVLAKGPLHLAFWYALLVPVLWKARRLRELILPPHLVGLILMVATFLPWAVANARRLPPKKSTGLWWEQLSSRLTFTDVDWGGWAMHPIEVVQNFLPWSIPLILAWWVLRKRDFGTGGESPDQRWNALIRGSQWGILIGVAMILVVPEGLARFTMPLFAPAVILTVDLLRRVDPALRERWDPWFYKGGLFVLLGCAVAGILAPVVVGMMDYPTAVPTGILVMLAALGAAWFLYRRRRWHFSIVWCVALLFAVMTVLVHGMPVKLAREKYRPDAAALSRALPDQDRLLLLYDPGHLRFLFYLHRPWTEADRIGDMPENPGYLMIQPEDLKEDKVRRWLEEFEWREIGRFEVQVEGKDFHLLELNPKA